MVESGLEEQDNVEYNRSYGRHSEIKCTLCANLCMWASYGPFGELCPLALVRDLVCA